KQSLTGQYLSGKKQIAVPSQRRPGNGKRVTVKGARHHNLKNVDVEFPLGLFVCVTGVSGSGKSSLVNDILKEGLKQRYGVRTGTDEAENGNGAEDLTEHTVGAHDAILGAEQLDKVIDIDQT